MSIVGDEYRARDGVHANLTLILCAPNVADLPRMQRFVHGYEVPDTALLEDHIARNAPIDCGYGR